MMSFRFRNLEVTPNDPVDRWGVEGIVTVIDRGGSREWHQITLAVTADPYGPVATQLEQALQIAESAGVTSLMRRVLKDARLSDQERVVQRVRAAFRGAEMTQTAYATLIGTSRSRLSTYLAGTVAPSAVMLVRMERVTDARRAHLAP